MIIIISLLKDIYDCKYVGLRLFDLDSNEVKCVQINDVLDKILKGNKSIYGLYEAIDHGFMGYNKDDNYSYSIADTDLKKLDREQTYKDIINRLKYYMDTEEVVIRNYNNSNHVKYVYDGDKLAYRIANYKDGALLYSYEVKSVIYRTDNDINELTKNTDIYRIGEYTRDKVITPILDKEHLSDNEINTLNKLESSRNSLYQNIGIEEAFGTNSKSVKYIGDDILAILGELDAKYDVPSNIKTLVLRYKGFYTDITTSIKFKPSIRNIVSMNDYCDLNSVGLHIIKSECFNVKYISTHALANRGGCLYFDNDVYCDCIEINTEAFYNAKGIKSDFNVKFNVNRIHELAFTKSAVVAKNFELYSNNTPGIIESMAFSYTHIDTLTLGNGLKISDSAFYGCHIDNLIINGDIEVLNGNIFRYCEIDNLSIGDNCNKLYGKLFNKRDCTIDNEAYVKTNGNIIVYGAGTPNDLLYMLIGMDNVILGDNSCENFKYDGCDTLVVNANLNGTDIFKGSKIDGPDSVVMENISKAVGCFRDASISTGILRINTLQESMFERCKIGYLRRLDLPDVINYIPCRAFYKTEFKYFELSVLEWLNNHLSKDSVIDKEAFAYVSEYSSYGSYSDIELACSQIGVSAFEGAILWKEFSELSIKSDKILKSAFKNCAIICDLEHKVNVDIEVISSHIEKEALCFRGVRLRLKLNEDATFIDKDCLLGREYILGDYPVYTANGNPLQNDDVDLVVKKYFLK